MTEPTASFSEAEQNLRGVIRATISVAFKSWHDRYGDNSGYGFRFYDDLTAQLERGWVAADASPS